MREERKKQLINDANLLLSLLNKNNGYVSKETICNELPLVFVKNTNKEVHDICSYIWVVKDFINNNIETFGYLVISNSKGDLKIPNKEEILKQLEREERIKARSWKRLWNKKKALGLENQLTLDGYVYNVVSKV